jgi:CDP-paratose 2-epimerase
MKILITGGAGFVGSSLARAFKAEDSSARVTVIDNLKRRGSELNLPLLKQDGIDFLHGDIRNGNDLDVLDGTFDLLIEASAEPSVQAGIDSSPQYAFQTNLSGTFNCLEFARKRAGSFLFLSTSRVYSIAPLKQVRLVAGPTRFTVGDQQNLPGLSERGIDENFPTHLPRSIYGATKLASELIIQEYAETYGLRSIINRCGVIAGPGQFGKVDQGVFTMWVANHIFGKPLAYKGFGGQGKQVRDLLHPLDLFSLVRKQVENIENHSGEVFNVGGGPEVSTSLAELTTLCQTIVGNKVPVSEETLSSSVDIPWYVSDYSRAAAAFDWRPQHSVPDIVADISRWIQENEAKLRPIFN